MERLFLNIIKSGYCNLLLKSVYLPVFCKKSMMRKIVKHYSFFYPILFTC